ncbi:MAG: hypothetical protein R3C56_19355 [Pirellulaceae bacterium]
MIATDRGYNPEHQLLANRLRRLERQLPLLDGLREGLPQRRAGG